MRHLRTHNGLIANIRGNGIAPLLLTHISKRPIEGGGANAIVGIKGGYRPPVPPMMTTPLQSISAGGDLLNSIAFARNTQKNKKRDNIKFVY